ncbi:hypothetical protein DLAC_01103 [Tieghemostelium lacteum]|uniref:Transmembrane protein n=1 Tax=Tieghemostelium lacteum TaxID=361077 RepID=A0A152A7R0_TIELA|nr:hypothetical protein DLAC_01103 [Tieghemostelium lacteum]|eukprot:KYR02272.1 hypothetical protein DLAC_01103 [Tieghemostelium lacteum]
MNTPQFWFTLGSFNAALAVGLGAFGSHGLQKITQDPKKIEAWKTASNYHLLHSFATVLAPFSSSPLLVGSLFTAGTILFSGSLYGMVLTEKKKLGPITPIGGLAMMGGWFALGLSKFVR